MKTILVPYHEDDAARAALKLAILLAKRFGGYLEGLLVMGEPRLNFAPGLIMPPEYLTAAVEDWRRYADRARQEFTRAVAAHELPMGYLESASEGPAAGWQEIQGDEAEVVGERGRLFDLIVVGRPHPSAATRWREIQAAALFESGHPVLLAPPDPPAEMLGRTVVIAWNGSVETARTLSFGMPFLTTARRVEVLTVEGHVNPGPSAAEVVAHLAWHGITATARSLKPEGRPAGEVILDEAGDIGADLILKGAFTRSRFRQVVFGGMTQHILDYAKVPVLLAH